MMSLTGEYHYIGDKSRKVEDWYAYPAQMDVRNFYGGSAGVFWIRWIICRITEVDVIYFNPLFVSPSNHKYDIQVTITLIPMWGKSSARKGASAGLAA